MPTLLNPYISFKDTARQAMEFYQSVFGGTLELSTFKESGAPAELGEENLIMHGLLKSDNGMTIMASDTPSSMEYNPGTNISISLSGDNEEELSAYFHKLSQDGQASMPLAKAPWGDTFGMLTDKFGIAWMVNIAGNKE
jgi:PhnB protein